MLNSHESAELSDRDIWISNMLRQCQMEYPSAYWATTEHTPIKLFSRSAGKVASRHIYGRNAEGDRFMAGYWEGARGSQHGWRPTTLEEVRKYNPDFVAPEPSQEAPADRPQKPSLTETVQGGFRALMMRIISSWKKPPQN